MRFSFLFTLFSLLILVACSKGKDCSQLYHNVISYENRTNRNLVLEFVDSNNTPYTIEMKSLENANSRVIKEYYVTHEGGLQKGGAPYDAQCTSEPYKMGTSSYLSENSFGTVKNCWDNENSKSIILETSERCPSNTFEQLHSGLPKQTILLENK